MEKNIKVILIENDLDFVFLLQQLLHKDSTFSCLGYATNKTDGIRLACEVQPDIVLMDLNLSSNELAGIETSMEIRRQTNAKVIILTSFEDYDTVIHACIHSFASGYLFKTQFDTILPYIKQTAAGHTPHEYLIRSLILSQLTSAERTILERILGNPIDIYSSNKTIANQKTNIFRKLGLKSQKEVIHILGDYL
ncbi:response regulator [Anaerocolumna sp. MB42-C2]|uniref:response regulator n=1 Tax=Anaerocolumna sp. MB42-C2 TaxID=3070997 RepID=UPI0027DF008B|nr:response regulator transcription factor [Anaerocolumna sp. MB42-C2]WMJ85869.1 response regulator transcription factor [Anaerocolumna sp. MB42-C2]